MTAEMVAARLTTRAVPGPPTPAERALAEVLADALHMDQVPLDAHFFDDLGADSMVMTRFCALVRKRPDLPSISIRDVYRNPTIAGLATTLAPAAPVPGAAPATAGTQTALAEVLAGVLADVLETAQVDVDAHFFDDLGADSMVMTRFCAKVRKRPDLPQVSIKDVYQHPTLRSLATALAPAPAPVEAAPAPVPPVAPMPEETPAPAGRAEYVLTGALQLLLFLGYAYLGGLLVDRGYEWIVAGSGWVDYFLRTVLFGSLSLVVLCAVPIVAKWALIGRWKPQEIRIWSLAYIRFWLVKTLVRANPVLLFAGERGQTTGCSPLYPLYLRALGAKIGRGVTIYSRNVPVCTDLLTIGDGTVLRKDTFFNCYRAHGGVIQTGPVTLGKDVFVGETTVLDIGTAMGDGAQLGHASALQAGQTVPAGESWHGSPAQRGDLDYRGVPPADCGPRRRAWYVVGQLATTLWFHVPLSGALLGLVLVGLPWANQLLGSPTVSLTGWALYRDALIVSAVLFFGVGLVGLVLVGTVPRLLDLAIRPDRVYRLYGVHYGIHRLIARLTNIKFYKDLFGDSSYIVHYLRWLGYDLTHVEQTGSNFGTMVKHETPFHVSVGRGSMVADGLSIINADFSSTSFRLSRASIGAHSFLGNNIAYPSQSRAGDNCLLATRVLVPVDGEVRTDVGLLGSPSFEIPRTVLRDSRMSPKSQAEFRRRLRAKNRYNLRSMGLFLLMRWGLTFGLITLGMATTQSYRDTSSEFIVQLQLVLTLLFSLAYSALMERAVARFRSLRPQYCSIYDPYFWWHERFWKFSVPAASKLLAGTPFMNVFNRLLGVRMGRMVFDDGCGMPERTLITLGDHCTLNADTHIQCHSQEDGAFKSDRIRVGAGVTVGVGAFVHYGVTVGDGAALAAGSFLMKGEEVPQLARWGGNPAQEMPALERPGTPAELPARTAPPPAALAPAAPARRGRHRASRRRHLARSSR